MAEKPKVFGYPHELETLGDHIRAARLDRDLFQKDVARLIGVTTDTVTNWEKGRSNPDLKQIPRVLEFLGYDPRPKDDSIASQLTRARQARGLSQKELARILKVDPSTLSKWEQGKRTQEGQYIEAVKRFLNAPYQLG